MEMSVFNLTGKVAIITGAGRGIGKDIALSYAKAGADVVAVARTLADIENTAAEVRRLGRKALAVKADVCEYDQVENMLRETLEGFGRVDILVNNAGGSDDSGSKYIVDLSLERWKNAFAKNLDSLFICNKIVGTVMVGQRSGCIINMSSGVGLGPCPGDAPAAAAKAAANNLTMTLAQEWGPYNVRVNAILPGLIETPLTADHLGADSGGRREALMKHIPLGRIGRPEDIAPTAVFLASDAAAYISGALIYISGGVVGSIPVPKILGDIGNPRS